MAKIHSRIEAEGDFNGHRVTIDGAKDGNHVAVRFAAQGESLGDAMHLLASHLEEFSQAFANAVADFRAAQRRLAEVG